MGGLGQNMFSVVYFHPYLLIDRNRQESLIFQREAAQGTAEAVSSPVLRFSDGPGVG